MPFKDSVELSMPRYQYASLHVIKHVTSITYSVHIPGQDLSASPTNGVVLSFLVTIRGRRVMTDRQASRSHFMAYKRDVREDTARLLCQRACRAAKTRQLNSHHPSLFLISPHEITQPLQASPLCPLVLGSASDAIATRTVWYCRRWSILVFLNVGSSCFRYG
jgi:hypothetical protein